MCISVFTYVLLDQIMALKVSTFPVEVPIIAVLMTSRNCLLLKPVKLTLELVKLVQTAVKHSIYSSKENLRVKFSKHQQIPPNALHNTIQHRKFSSETKPVSVKEHRYLNKKEMEEDLSITIVGASNNDNVMMPFVKPSLSALHRKQNIEEERVRRKEEGLAGEEVEMEEEEEVGEEGVGREREEERGRFFRLLEKVKISLMKALVNLKHFLW